VHSSKPTDGQSIGFGEYLDVQARALVSKAYLNEILSFSLGDKRLQLRGGEGVDESRLGDHK
jgi:hypothetical protein